jgi:hypothetical protein
MFIFLSPATDLDIYSVYHVSWVELLLSGGME